MANYSFTFKDDSLEHHGIDGQKWGVRNGPPYPLAAGDHSAAEKRAMRSSQKATYKIIKRKHYKSKVPGHINTNKRLDKELNSKIKEKKNELIELREKANKQESKDFANLLVSFSVNQIASEIAKEVLGDYYDKSVYSKVKIPGEYSGKVSTRTAGEILRPIIRSRLISELNE